MSIKYQVEQRRDVLPEMREIFPIHWAEIANNQEKIKLDIAEDKYDAYERDGNLHVVTVRDNGKLIGYYVGIISTHLHYKKTLMCFTDIYYLLKEYRKGFTGVRMFKFVEESAKKRGAQMITAGMKLHHDNTKLFEYLGWGCVEKVFTKYLGD